MLKKISGYLIISVMALSLIGCGSKTTTTATAKKPTIGLSMAGVSSAYLIPVANYAKQEAAKDGANLILMDAQWDPAKQADQMANLIAQKVDAIIIVPVDAKSALPSLKKAKAAKIPVINLNMKVDNNSANYVNTYVGASMPKEGEAAADLMIAALGGKGGQIAIIEGAPGSDAQIYRTQAFESKIATVKNIKIVSIVNGNWDRAKAMSAAEDLMTKNPNLVGIYCHDDNMAVGAIQAAKAANKADKIKFVGIGGSIDGLSAVKSGNLYGTVTQPPDWEGSQGVKSALEVIKGTTLKTWYQDPVEKVTKDNVSKFKGLW